MPRSSNAQIRSFGKQLRCLRSERGLTQEQLAENSQLTVDQIAQVERGEISPSLTTLRRLTVGLGLARLSELLESI